MKSPNTTSDKLDEIIGELYFMNWDGNDKQREILKTLEFTKTAKQQILAYFKTEMNKLLPEMDNKIWVFRKEVKDSIKGDPIIDIKQAELASRNATIRQIKESLDKWGR